MKRKHSDVKQNPNCSKTEKKKKIGYVGDPLLLSRVREYLVANKKKPTVSVSWMSDDLQARYSEYTRKKKDAFRKCVERAYNTVCQEGDVNNREKYSSLEKAHLLKKSKKVKGIESDDSSSDSDSSDDARSFSSGNPDYTTYEDTNSMNTFMTSLYKQTPKHPAGCLGLRHSSPLRTRSTPSSPYRGNQAENESPLFIVDRQGRRKSQADELQAKPFMPKDKTVTEREGTVVLDLDDDFYAESSIRDRQPAGWHQVDHSGSVVDVSRGKEIATAVKAVTKREKMEAKDKPSRAEDAEKKEHKMEKTLKKKAKVKDQEDGKKKAPTVQQSQVKFVDIGGNNATLKEVCKLLVHMKHPEVYQQLGVAPPRGLLLHGPPGCGKTLLANAIAGELELPYIKLAATEIVSGVSGESEEKLRDLFEKARASAPCIVFLDEIDAITQKRETASKDMERRIVSQLLTCMDDLNSNTTGQVMVIGATNRPDSLDPALRRAGRFDREISLGIPDETARQRILEVLCRDLRLEPDFDFQHLARETPGYVGADLMSLAREAAITAVDRVFHELQRKPQTVKPGAGTLDSVESQLVCPSSDVDTKGLDCSAVAPPEAAASLPCDKQSDTEAFPSEAGDLTQEDVPHAQQTSQDLCPEQSSAENLSSQHVINGGKTLSQVQSGDSTEYQSVLHWLKDQPPLTSDQLQQLWITQQDFEEALKRVQPSAKREGFATIPGVTWDDIGALKDVRQELQLAILAPVRHPKEFQSLGLTNPPGILLAGPPGCGKTLLAKAVANESGINFISVKGPELLNMYVGESERAVRQVFQRARNSSPCVIFFDELDALCPRRSDAGEGGASVRVVNQLLTEMDGLEERKQVFLMAATNRPDIIDPAILRPGRLDKILYVGLPQAAERWEILKTITKNGTKPKLAEDVDLESVSNSKQCQGYTGADLAALVREASVSALREFMTSPSSGRLLEIGARHFQIALDKVKPSVSEKDQVIYRQMKENRC